MKKIIFLLALLFAMTPSVFPSNFGSSGGGGGTGDMEKATYDTNSDSKVDVAAVEAVGGNQSVPFNTGDVYTNSADFLYNDGARRLDVYNLRAANSVTAPVVISGVDSYDNNLVLDGDSLTVGTGGTNPYSFYMTSLRQTFTIVNQGQGADRMSGLVQYASSQVDPLLNRKAAYNVIIAWAGTNDFVYGATAPEVYQLLVAYARGRQKVGYKVIVGTMISRDALETQKNAYNKLIRDNYLTFADGIADFAANANLGADGACNNVTYFDVDKTHLNDTGYALVGAIAQEAVNRLTDMVPASWSGTKAPIAIGRKAGSTLYNASSDGLIFIGDSAGAVDTASSSYDVLCVGSNSCTKMHGHSTVAVGNNALNIANGAFNYTVAIGDAAMKNSVGDATYNTVIGSTAGEQLNYTDTDIANNNLIAGSRAARYVGDASRNVVLGDDAWEKGVAGNDNTYVGYQVAYSGGWSTLTDKNTCLGSKTCQAMTTAEGNLVAGYLSGNTTTTGDYNTLIGNQVTAPSATTSGYLNLANVLYSDDADSTGTTPSTGKIGLGVAPDATNAVNLAGPAMIQSGGSAGHAICWKADGKTLGYCSDAPDASGVCTCA